ncbi:MAG: hypothetical protein NZM43_07295 [Saprospiraceae bacterium]|nr:hypothetical protein [Saprospiraceae bacterium]MDW8484113.1 trigger factor [Saprospiraceae bacterium]
MPHIEKRLLEEEHILQFHLTFFKEEIASRVEEQIRNLVKTGTMKGFRPGHVPSTLIRSRYEGHLVRETYQNIIEESIEKIGQDEDALYFIGPPLMVSTSFSTFPSSVKKIAEENVAIFEVGLFPKEVKGLDPENEYEKIVLDLSDELVQQEIRSLSLLSGTDREIEEGITYGDVIQMEAVELAGDSPKEGGLHRTLRLLLSKEKIQSLAESFVGHAVNDVLRVRLGILRELISEDFYRRWLEIPEEEGSEIGDWFEVTIRKVYRREPAPLTKEFFNAYFGKDVSTEEEALRALKESIKGMYAHQLDGIFLVDVLNRLNQLNEISWPHRYTKKLFSILTDSNLEDVDEQEYQNFLKKRKWNFLFKYLREKTKAYPSKEDVVVEAGRRIHNYLAENGRLHLMEKFWRETLKDREYVEKIEFDLTHRAIASALPSLITVKERPVALEKVKELLRERKKELDDLQTSESKTSPTGVEVA